MLRKLFLIVCVPLFIAACDSTSQYQALPERANVLILGDSLTYGTGAAEGEDYATLLATSTGWNVINAGVPGNKSADGLARLPDLLAEYHDGAQKLDLLLVELGGNDFLKKVAQAETKHNLQTILMQAKVKNIPTVLLAIPEFSPIGAAFGSLSDHPLYAQLADEANTPLISNIFSDVLANNNLKADPIHPNAEGYRKVESELREALVRLGFIGTNN